MTSLYICSHHKSISWIAALSLFLVFFSFYVHGFFSIFLTSLLLILLTFLFTFSKKKTLFDHGEKLTQNRPLDENETITHHNNNNNNKKQESVEECCDEVEYINVTANTLSENESTDYLSTSEEDSDMGWPYRSSDVSDGSISDEENLIEIAIPSGQYVSTSTSSKDEEKCGKWKHGLIMELLAEYNEEEKNLIEIDLSIGSIKSCSRFENIET